uniref:Uncharacterized protein n=1 Tax=Glossina palpalis gambiensis TaxID=67801 RepID=A0A1B0AW35_9MUSC
MWMQFYKHSIATEWLHNFPLTYTNTELFRPDKRSAPYDVTNKEDHLEQLVVNALLCAASSQSNHHNEKRAVAQGMSSTSEGKVDNGYQQVLTAHKIVKTN